MYTGFYIRINTEDELQLFCDYLNQRYPYKSHWASDHSKNKEIYPCITKKYIKDKINPFSNTLFINMKSMIIQYVLKNLIGGTEYNGNKVLSVSDFVEDINKQNLPKWLNNIV